MRILYDYYLALHICIKKLLFTINRLVVCVFVWLSYCFMRLYSYTRIIRNFDGVPNFHGKEKVYLFVS